MRGVGNLTRAAYATAYVRLIPKSPNFQIQSEIRLDALRVLIHTRRVLVYRVLGEAFGDAWNQTR